jgi:hypothetical protein
VDRVEDISVTLRNTELDSMLQNRDFRNTASSSNYTFISNILRPIVHAKLI